MATNDPAKIAKIAITRFIREVVADQFDMSGPTENITEWLLTRSTHFFSFYNMVKSHVLHGGGLTEVEPGDITKYRGCGK
jgi:hypothetical protein